MLTIEELDIPGYEKVIEGKDPARGLHCFIAVHNTQLGPALGGTRIHPYKTSEAALKDVLRLAKAMTYKSAAIQDGLGGGKSVIIANPHKEKSQELLHGFAEVLDSLKGLYIAAEDVGSNTHDMNTIHQRTPYVAATSNASSTGDPSPFTAWGVFRGIQAACMKLFGSPCLQGKTVAIQGLGSVGGKLANHLYWHGANLLVSDIHADHVRPCVTGYGATEVPPEEILTVECDIFAPCAMGEIINEETIKHLRCKAIAGAANNQLATPEQGKQLQKMGILYAPDYIINAGGLINASSEYEPGGYNPICSRNKTDKIYDHLIRIFQEAEEQEKTTTEIANQLAEYNLLNGVGKRTHPITFAK